MPTPAAPRHRAALGALVLLAALLRVLGLGDESYWYDEIQSALQTRGSYADLLRDLVRSDVHPPLYPTLLWSWERLVGSSEAATRSLSALFGVAAVVAMYLAARSLAPRREALVAAGFVALSPFAVFYSQESRSYSLNLLLSLVGLWRLARWCAAPASRRAAVAYAAVATLVAYAHVYGLFVLCAHGLYVLAFEPALRRRFALAGLAVAALFAPWAPAFLGQVSRVEQHFWIPALTWRSPFAWVWAWGGLNSVTALVTVALIARGLTRPPVDRTPRDGPARPDALLGLLATVPVVVPVVASVVAQPIFHPKYAISILGPIALWSARALCSLPAARARGALLACVFALWLGALWVRVYGVVNKEQWREIAAEARVAAARGDVVATEADTARCMRWYLRDVPVRPIADDADVAAVEREARARGAEVFYLALHPVPSLREPALDRRWRRLGVVTRYCAAAVRYRVDR